VGPRAGLDAVEKRKTLVPTWVRFDHFQNINTQAKKLIAILKFSASDISLSSSEPKYKIPVF
jgi:hypothetical protein